MTVEYTYDNTPSNINLMKLLYNLIMLKVTTAGLINGIDVCVALSEASETGNGSIKYTVLTHTLEWKAPGDASYGTPIILKEEKEGRHILLPAEGEAQADSIKGLMVYFASFATLPASNVELTDLACAWNLSNKSCLQCRVANDADPATSDPTTLTVIFDSGLDESDLTALQACITEVIGA